MVTNDAKENAFLSGIKDDIEHGEKLEALQQLTTMVEPDQYVGDLINLDYAHADILVHDTHKNRTNGIPHGLPPHRNTHHPSRPRTTKLSRGPFPTPHQSIRERQADH